MQGPLGPGAAALRLTGARWRQAFVTHTTARNEWARVVARGRDQMQAIRLVATLALIALGLVACGLASDSARGCPEPTDDSLLHRDDEQGFCLLYPGGYRPIVAVESETCFVPAGPQMACHNANLFVTLESAAGRTADLAADELVAEAQAAVPGIDVQRTTLAVAGEQAVVLEGLPGVDSSRRLLIAHADRLYTLTFVPWDPTSEQFDQLGELYGLALDSFGFVPQE